MQGGERGNPLVSDEEEAGRSCVSHSRPAKPGGASDNLSHPHDLIEPSFDTG